MSWHAMTVDGVLWDPMSESRVSFRTGNPSLEEVMRRLGRRLIEVEGTAAGRWKIGLRSAIIAQLTLSVWDSWGHFRTAEQKTGVAYPTMHPSVIDALCSGKPSRSPMQGADGDGFLLS